MAAREVRVVARVQAHPSRRLIRGRLLAGLEGVPTEVVETDFTPPNPWHGYRACLESLVGEEFTHALIVQDDAIACHNLPAALDAIAAITDVPVCLFMPMVSATRKEATLAGARGECFTEVVPRGFLPVVAVLWPREKALHFLDWAHTTTVLRKGNGRTVQQRSDDAMGYMWMRTQRQKALVTIPSLIQHPDDVPSTITRGRSGRTALFWHEPPWDPMTIEWRV